MVIQSFWPKDPGGSICNGRIRVNSEFCSTSGNMHARYVQGMSLPVADRGDGITPSPKPTSTHLHCSMQKQRLHPSLNQYTWSEAGDELLSKIPHEHEFGSKNACTWGEEGDSGPAYHMLLERPPTWETGLVGCVAHTPAALLAEITSTCCPSALGGHQYLHGSVSPRTAT